MTNKTSYIVQFHHIFNEDKSPILFFDSEYRTHCKKIDKPHDSMTSPILTSDHDRLRKIYSVIDSVKRSYSKLYMAVIGCIEDHSDNKTISKYVLYNNDWFFLLDNNNINNILQLESITKPDYIEYIKKFDFSDIEPNL